MNVKMLSFVVLGATGLLCLSSCSNTEQKPDQPAPSVAAVTLSDPLLDLTNPKSENYNDEATNAVLHERVTGPRTFTVKPPSGAGSVQYFVACEPASKFTVTAGELFSSGCDNMVGNSGAIPVTAKESDDNQIKVNVDIPAGVTYWIVGIPFRE